ncbi:hypothetical protein [Anthocerotibacter panamensis]|uniref:hypothetical protein n=1 Tax=Anthocerotibacter panamensis TaxID=2857077 RepID=UPI001C406FCC|nr:hypothetical protein [Anthocerotibacter panamensis]
MRGQDFGSWVDTCIQLYWLFLHLSVEREGLPTLCGTPISPCPPSALAAPHLNR